MDARTRFERTRAARKRLDEINLLIMFDDDWHPEGVRASNETSDPTANRAIYIVDEREEELKALLAEQCELQDFIGLSLVIIEGVRDGFGEIYATLLDHRYIDVWTWRRIHDELGITRDRGRYLLDVAFDWIDSVGVSRLLAGKTEL
jgi:dihydrofolate reductase